MNGAVVGRSNIATTGASTDGSATEDEQVMAALPDISASGFLLRSFVLVRAVPLRLQAPG